MDQPRGQGAGHQDDHGDGDARGRETLAAPVPPAHPYQGGDPENERHRRGNDQQRQHE
jgi:hypothetical protein